MKKYFAILACVAVTVIPSYSFAQVHTAAAAGSSSSSVKVINVDQEVKDILAVMKQQLSASTAEIVRLKDANYTLRNALVKKDEDIARLTRYSFDSNQSESLYKPKIDLLSQQLNQASQQIVSLKAENDKYKVSLQSLAKQPDIDLLNQKLSQANSQIDALKAENQSYKFSLQSLTNSEKNTATDSMLISQLQNENSTLKLNYSKVKNELASLKDSYVTLQTSYKAVKQQETIAANYKRQIDDLSAKLISVNSELTQTKQSSIPAVQQGSQQTDLLLKKISALEVQNDALKSALVKESMDNSSLIVKVADYMKSSNSDPAILYYNMGKAYQDSKNYAKAITNYKQALAVNSNFGKAYCDLGLVYAEMGDVANAKTNLKIYLSYTSNQQEKTVIQNFITKLEKVSAQS